ncbi:MAG TPA: aminodeoxychorismate lyase, partial [Betaproteobacteria bacterium]|nr:aminodeoxychorismate lyase [Betaproteobacteria bacterium]
MILVNGVETDSVHATDRGLGYGDGVFRTLRIQAGKVRCWARQISKLEADCAILRIPCPSHDTLLQAVTRAADAEPDCIAKWIVTRGSGARGYAPPPSPSPTWVMLTAPVPPALQRQREDGVKLRLCETRLGLQPRLAGVKHLNRLENVLARMEWTCLETAEGLMLDTEGRLISGTMSNLFLVRGNRLYTPDLSRCGVAGVQRAR